MDAQHHDLPDLFAQLGLPDDEASIRAFIDGHRPLADDVKLAAAPFWTDGQRTFLREAKRSDADWALVVDALDAQLREQPLATLAPLEG